MTDPKRKKSFADDIVNAGNELQKNIEDMNEAIHGASFDDPKEDEEEVEDEDEKE